MKFFLFILLFVSTVASASELKILSWNLFMLPKPILFSGQQTRAKLMAKELAKTSYDIIVMQEAFSGPTRQKLRQALKAKYPYQITLVRDNNFLHFLNSGVFVVSRHPFKVLEQLYYSDCTNTDCFASKGALFLEITLPDNKKVQMATTHLQAWNTEKSRLVRRSQLTEIKETFDRFAFTGIPQILVGDLNIDAFVGSEYTESLKFLGMTSTPLTGPLNYTNGYLIDCFKVPGNDAVPEWIDHVWLNSRGTVATVVDKAARPFTGMIDDKLCPLSDHHALEARITL
jgi:endonuclease/exonuclease/phosphatase family metal-dependent hydrolase